MIPLLVVLAFFGLTISLYFTLVFFHLIDTSARYVPQFCWSAARDCAAIVHHPDASVFSVPNSVLGMFYYTAVLIAISQNFASALPMVIVSWFTVAVGVYLIYSLLRRVRVLCVLCLAAHVVNLFIALSLTIL
jgi:uncharacterized membrane protein